MTDDLVKQFVEHLRFGGVGVQVRADSCAPLADAIDALTAERDRLREALRDIAKQKKTTELETEYDVECADFEGGYDAIIDVAREALKGETP